MALRGKKPEIKNPRLKLLMFSPAGIGKTRAAIQMPRPYIIDTEAGTAHYGELIEKSNGAVFQTADIEEVIAEVRELMTSKHPYKTLVIDAFTPMYEAKVEEGALKNGVGDQFGKHTAYANRYAAKLFRMLSLLDMNVVATSHAKDVWAHGEKQGVTFDGWKKLDYLFDLALELQRRGKKRVAVIRKTRLAAFPDQETFDWSFEELAARWGEENLTREAEAVAMASPAQVSDLSRKVVALNLPSDTVDKWLRKAEADRFDEMTADVIGKCIAYCDKKLAAASNEKEEK